MQFPLYLCLFATLAADLSLSVSYSVPWNMARLLNETGFRAALNYAAGFGLGGTVPRSGLKSGQRRLTVAFRRAFKPQRGDNQGSTSLLRNVRDTFLKRR